jgi:hypothetical protein
MDERPSRANSASLENLRQFASETIMENQKNFSLLILCAVLGACGGGGGFGTTTPPLEEPPPDDPVFGGVWAGLMTIDASLGSEECAALVTEDGQFRFFCAFDPIQLVGMQSNNSGAVVGSGLAISSLVFLDGTTVTNLSMEGTLVEKDSFTGTWTTDSPGDSGSFEFFYDSEYERPSSLALLEGIWSGFDDLGNPTATFTIDNLGQFTGQNSFNCTSSGSFMILDARYNVYQVISTISGCAMAGQYSGLAAVGDIDNPNDAIVLATDNGEQAILLGLQK